MSTLLISYPINLGSTKQQSKNIKVGAIDLHHCVALVMLLKPVLLSGHVTWMSAGIAHFYYFLPTCYRILDCPSLLANMSLILYLYPWWGLFVFSPSPSLCTQFQLLSSEDLLLFFFSCDRKLNLIVLFNKLFFPIFFKHFNWLRKIIGSLINNVS